MASKRTGFHAQSMYKLRKPPIIHYVKRRFSFLIASLSVIAFMVGNMAGQHGWYTFWHAVFGAVDPSMVVFDGTVPPIQSVAGPMWSLFGGDPQEHMYAELPDSVKIPLPEYDASKLKDKADSFDYANMVYCTGNGGDYKTGRDHSGAHTGVDICRVPKGTPVLSIANGIVEKVSMQDTGFGRHVVIAHYNVPDPDHPGKMTTLYSGYAHLDTITVTVGELVSKSRQIGTVGRTGFATQYHLHFQLDRDSAPFHPYWAFTSTESKEAGLTYTQSIDAGLHAERIDEFTLSPMLFVQQYGSYTSPVGAIVKGVQSTTVLAMNTDERSMTAKDRRLLLRSERIRVRLAKRQLQSDVFVESSVGSTQQDSSTVSSESALPVPVTSTVKTAKADTPVTTAIAPVSNTDVDHMTIEHDGQYDRGVELIRVRTVGNSGELVKAPLFPDRIYVRTAYGEAEISPDELTAGDFFGTGEVQIKVMPRGQRTVVFELKGAFETVSEPMVYKKQ